LQPSMITKEIQGENGTDANNGRAQRPPDLHRAPDRQPIGIMDKTQGGWEGCGLEYHCCKRRRPGTGSGQRAFG